LVSATPEIKKSKNNGKKGTTNHTFSWHNTTSLIFKEPTLNNIVIRIIPIDTS